MIRMLTQPCLAPRYRCLYSIGSLAAVKAASVIPTLLVEHEAVHRDLDLHSVAETHHL